MKRPGFVTFLTVLNLLAVPFYLFFALLFNFEEDLILGIVLLVIAVLQIVAAIGLLKLRPFGRFTQLILSWVGLLLFPFGTIASVLVLFYLYRNPVRLLFRPADCLNPEERSEVETFHRKSFAARAGAILVLCAATVILTASMMVPGLIGAPSLGRQKRTMADMRTFATAVEAYAVDHKFYPAARSAEQLIPKLQPEYIRQLPLQDGWGHPLRYQTWREQASSGGADCFAIASAGKGGKWEVADLREYEPAKTKTLEADIVWRCGGFIRYPERSAP
jgi:type II secretory pathway pseudopilin PulG